MPLIKLRLLLLLLVISKGEAYEYVSKDNFRKHVKALSSDLFEGREPLTQGEELTVNYLIDEFKKLGLSAGVNNSFVQKVSLAKISTTADSSFQLGKQHIINKNDYVLFTETQQKKSSLKNSELVWVGYGINAPEYNWNDYKNIDVRGKTVVVLVNDPGFATKDNSLFSGKAMTYYGRWNYKYEEAMRQGAAGALIVYEESAAGYPWSVVQSLAMVPRQILVDKVPQTPPVLGWIKSSVIEKAFLQANLSFSTEKKLAHTKGFIARNLNLKANIRLKHHIDFGVSQNVIAKWPGKNLAKEAIVISAHWDHIGKKYLPDGRIDIYNGAIDNATGVAGLLELTRIISENKMQFERTILFVSYTAEEAGALGAEAFALKPPIDLHNLIAVLNMDGLNVNESIESIIAYGKGLSSIDAWLERSAKKLKRTVITDPQAERGYYFRSDHFALAKQGIPGLLFMNLDTNGPDYIQNRYHKPADIYQEHWLLDGIVEDLNLILVIINDIANTEKRPKWLKTTAFVNKTE